MDAGVSEHELAMRALEHAMQFDQINVGELASMELLMRRAQLSELKYKDAVLRNDPADEYGDDAFLYLGTGQTRGQVMVNPDLEEFVSAQLSKEGAVMKERRNLHEERWFARGGRPPKKKGKGKGKDNEEVAPAGAQKT